MICKLFVFRHSETTDNIRRVFSGWRDPELTLKGLSQAREIAEQLRQDKIDYAFTSHLKRARKTLEIVLEKHPAVSVFTDDRLIERCYGLLQGKSERKCVNERPEWFAKVYRGYDIIPPEGESMKMVENRTLAFLAQLEQWLQQNPGNITISCHNNSMRMFRRVFKHLNIRQMLQIENSQDRAMAYALHVHTADIESPEKSAVKSDWRGILVPRRLKLATDQENPLKIYY